jgi:hypothetical protein
MLKCVVEKKKSRDYIFFSWRKKGIEDFESNIVKTGQAEDEDDQGQMTWTAPFVSTVFNLGLSFKLPAPFLLGFR